jgi:hypothetical protein
MTTIWIYDANRWGSYTVIYDDAVLLRGVRDPEHDAARALTAKGLTGVVTVRDAKTDALRSTVCLHKASATCAREDRRNSPYTARWRPYQGPR